MNKDRPFLLKNLLSNLHDLDHLCKEYYLQADKGLASLSIMITALLLPPMAYLDNLYYRFSVSFFISVFIELLFVVFSCIIILLIKPTTQVDTYEYWLFTWTGTTSLFAFLAVVLQPERIIENMLFCAIFFTANFISFPNRLLFRSLPAVAIYAAVLTAFLTNHTRFAFTDKYMFGITFIVLTTFGIFTIAANNHFKRTAFNLQRDERDKRMAYEALAIEKTRLSDLLRQELAERKHAEEAVRELNAKLEQRVDERTAELKIAIRELESFSYTVGHDLRTPLRSINGFSKMLIEDRGEDLPANVRKELVRIASAAKAMGEMLDALLDFSRLTRTPLRKADVNLSGMAYDFLSAATQPDTQLRITEGIIVHADPAMFRKLIKHLCENAIKFTSKTLNPIIEFGMMEQDEQEIYFVRDNGAGFDMAYARKLFQPFQRLHRDDEFSGHGVGLVISQRIIQRHGGRIWAEAAVDQGATFYFTLG